MADQIDITPLFADARAFLTELAADNTRDWFSAHKSRFDSTLKRPAEKLLSEVALWLAQEYGTLPRTKLFRPHRDMRFTEDKTPYHTHLHMMWSLSDGRAWMLGIAPDYATMGIGVMNFTPQQLDRFRAAVARDDRVGNDSLGQDRINDDQLGGTGAEGTNTGADGASLTQILAEGWRLDPPALKHVPPPHDAHHPRADLLRQKGLVAWADGLDEGLTRDPQSTVQQVIIRARPLMDWLARIT